MKPGDRPQDHDIVPPERIYIPAKTLGAIVDPYKLSKWGTVDNTDDSKNGKPKPLAPGKATDQIQ